MSSGVRAPGRRAPRVLLICGLGPTIKNPTYYAGSLLDPDPAEAHAFVDRAWPGLRLERLRYVHDHADVPLLQLRRSRMPHLTTFALQAILDRTGVPYDQVDAQVIWLDEPCPTSGDYDVVLLSTTFIWEFWRLRQAVDWAHGRWPEATIVVGGQYSNLKYARILRECPEVACVVRGDGEEALPRLLDALANGGDLDHVPNLVARDAAGGAARQTPLEYIDLEREPSPSFDAPFPIVPYESMRGCPFSCGFCSYPHASPKWRYKSARKIRDDWARYAAENGATLVKAMDSTFTVPPSRMRELFGLLPSLGMGWTAYSRANTIRTAEYVEQLAESGCRSLTIGFESMSDRSLKHMNKLVTADQNRRAFELLCDSPLGYQCAFMAGYPGETPEDYRLTHDFVVNEFSGYYIMSVFSLQDETMPVWEQAKELDIRLGDPEDYDYAWSHAGMDEPTARRLLRETLDEARRKNENAVLMHWQLMYEHPLMPAAPRSVNLRVEKLVERLAMVPVDLPDPAEARDAIAGCVRGLEALGVCLA